MVKLAFLVPSIENCGPINVVLNIIKYLNPSKVTPVLVAVKKGPENSYLFFLENLLDNKVFYLEDFDSNEFGLLNIIEQYNIDCIHSHGYYPDKIVSNINGVKKISTVHSMFFKDYLKEYGNLKGYVGAFLHFYYLKKSQDQIVVGCSKAVTKYCDSYIQGKKILTINNGVDHKKYKILSDEIKYIRKKELNLKGKRVFVYAGRFIRRKQVPELIDIFLKNASSNDVLVLLGDGPEKITCEQKYHFQNIIFLGQVSNPEMYYQIADFVISNSSAEGYPMSIIEAVSCGAYALLSDIPPHVEFVESHPQCASLLTCGAVFTLNPTQITNSDIESLSASAMAYKYSELYLS